MVSDFYVNNVKVRKMGSKQASSLDNYQCWFVQENMLGERENDVIKIYLEEIQALLMDYMEGIRKKEQ